MASDLDRILERLVVDAAFVDMLRRDPASALAGYEVGDDDLAVLAASVSGDPGSLGDVEERQNKSTLMGLAAGFAEAMEHHGGGAHHEVVDRPGAPSWLAGANGEDETAQRLMEMQHMMTGLTHQSEMLAGDLLVPDVMGEPHGDLSGGLLGGVPGGLPAGDEHEGSSGELADLLASLDPDGE